MIRSCTLLSVALVLFAAGCQQQPAVDGRTVTEWLAYAQQTDLAAQELGIEKLAACGPAAAPWLTAELAGSDERTIYPSARALLALGLDAPVRQALDAQQGAPQLAIAAACCHQNVAVAKALTVAFDSLEFRYQNPGTVVAVFEQLHSDAREAVPVVKQALTSPDPEVRWRAANVARKLSPFAADLAASCGSLLADPDVRVRRAAAWALQEFGPQAQPVLPALKSAAHDRDPEVRARVAAACQQLEHALW